MFDMNPQAMTQVPSYPGMTYNGQAPTTNSGLGPTTNAQGQYISPYQNEPTNDEESPIMPGFNQIYDPSTMSIGNDMSAALASDPTQFNTNALNELSANANSTAPSAWAQAETNLAKTQTQQAASQQAGQTAGSTAQAEGNLAMSGGLSSGASERAQENGQQAGIAAQQGTQNQGNQAIENISAQDAATKQQELQALPGEEAQAYTTSLQPIEMQQQANAQDVSNQMAGTQALNQFNMGAYGNQASMYGAGQTADAQTQAAQNSGGLFGGGGFLGTGSWLCSERNRVTRLSDDQRHQLSELLRYSRKVDRDFTLWYLRHGKTLVTLMKTTGEEWRKENDEFIALILSLTAQEKYHEAYASYKQHVYKLCDVYWPRLRMEAA